MYLKNIVLIGLFVMLTSCSLFKRGRSSASIDADKMTFYSKYTHTDSSQTACFVSDDFSTNALNKYTIKNINNKFLKYLHCSKEPVVNTHNSAVIDTIYTFSNAKNKIKIYRALQADFVFVFDVMDSKFTLDGEIKPGMTKEFFVKKFHIIEAIQNTVQIANVDGSMIFVFYFKHNRLKRIHSYVYID